MICVIPGGMTLIVCGPTRDASSAFARAMVSGWASKSTAASASASDAINGPGSEAGCPDSAVQAQWWIGTPVG